MLKAEGLKQTGLESTWGEYGIELVEPTSTSNYGNYDWDKTNRIFTASDSKGAVVEFKITVTEGHANSSADKIAEYKAIKADEDAGGATRLGILRLSKLLELR